MERRQKYSNAKDTVGKHLAPFLLTVLGCMMLLVFAPVFSSWAQDGSNADAFAQKFQERLQLSDEQMEQLRPIISEDMAKRKAILQKYQGHGQQGYRPMRGELDSLNADTEGKMSQILSAEQMEEYKKLRQEQVERMRERARTRLQQHQSAGQVGETE
ncbi:MAG TPA: hypothetical protein PKM59_00310 [Thermodesulfobacteriota bacterium]|nr:hypothetical protein [Thermodesulfobacteriota bacterium]HNU70896.1 hypothetical protein [Thermodesulfobacteriota bacterium]